MGDINSLLRFRKLPVFLLGNSARKSLISQKVGKRSFVPRLRYPVFFPVTRESHFRDGFAHDCLLQRRVTCELDLLRKSRSLARLCSKRTVSGPPRTRGANHDRRGLVSELAVFRGLSIGLVLLMGKPRTALDRTWHPQSPPAPR